MTKIMLDVFDMDGLIVNSVPMWKENNRALVELLSDIPFNEGEFRAAIKALSADKTMEKLQEMYLPEMPVEEIKNRSFGLMEERYHSMVELSESCIAYMKRRQSMGYTLAICTVNEQSLLNVIVERLFSQHGVIIHYAHSCNNSSKLPSKADFISHIIDIDDIDIENSDISMYDDNAIYLDEIKEALPFVNTYNILEFADDGVCVKESDVHVVSDTFEGLNPSLYVIEMCGPIIPTQGTSEAREVLHLAGIDLSKLHFPTLSSIVSHTEHLTQYSEMSDNPDELMSKIHKIEEDVTSRPIHEEVMNTLKEIISYGHKVVVVVPLKLADAEKRLKEFEDDGISVLTIHSMDDIDFVLDECTERNTRLIMSARGPLRERLMDRVSDVEWTNKIIPVLSTVGNVEKKIDRATRVAIAGANYGPFGKHPLETDRIKPIHTICHWK